MKGVSAVEGLKSGTNKSAGVLHQGGGIVKGDSKVKGL